MRNLFLLFISLFICSILAAQNNWQHGRIQVSANKHYLQYQDGTPFFWMGDTGWELFHRLKLEEINRYLTNRASKGFTLIQAVILAEFDGLRKPNKYGDVPFVNMDPLQPNEQYFKLVDTVVKLAQARGLVMGLLQTWGDKVLKMWGEGPIVFNVENAYGYGLFLGQRYQSYPNIIWILGGDRPAITDSIDTRPVWRSMAKGIKEGSGGKALFSYHISGGPNTTSKQIHTEDWLDINMMQSGHGSGHDVPVWNWIASDRALQPAKPTLDSEPNYEDHPVNPWPKWDSANGYFNDYDVRKQTYRSVFAGACGVTYGHHSIWQFYNTREEKVNHAKMFWTAALDRPGAVQMGYLKKLVLSRPSLQRIPDQSIITLGQGDKGNYMTAFRDSLGRYLMVYIPVGKTVGIKTGFIQNKIINANWFNPKNGTTKKIGLLARKETMQFTPPTAGVNNDWVLVVDDPSFK
ncbi:MAG: glycoside hydrolase family 140 protein [Chitinophagaceae bacterium]|nr:glycoside hydrolase family 140 protein [Chitinophagaceae bacterium]